MYNDEDYLGAICPACIENMQLCFRDLDAGNDSITG